MDFKPNHYERRNGQNTRFAEKKDDIIFRTDLKKSSLVCGTAELRTNLNSSGKNSVQNLFDCGEYVASTKL